MSTLNCTEEVLLAKKLIALHPWSGMVNLPEQEPRQMQLQ